MASRDGLGCMLPFQRTRRHFLVDYRVIFCVPLGQKRQREALLSAQRPEHAPRRPGTHHSLTDFWCAHAAKHPRHTAASADPGGAREQDPDAHAADAQDAAVKARVNLIELAASPDQPTDYALALNVLVMIALSQFKVRGSPDA